MKAFQATRRRVLKAGAAIAAITTMPILARAQSFPTRPIRIICPFPPGPVDVVMRAMALSASKYLGGTVIVENKPGAAGMLGAVEVSRSSPDGYVLTQVPDGHFIVPGMQKQPFDPVADFTFVVALWGSVYGMVVRADSPFKTVMDVFDFAKANPGKLSYSTAGIGTMNHLVMEGVGQKYGLNMLHVPYKGAAPAMSAVLSREVMVSSGASAWAPQVDNGDLRLLATYGSRRTRRWPHVSTLAEQGFGITADAVSGFAGPKGMDPSVTRRLHDALRTSLDDPATQKAMAGNSFEPFHLDPQAYTKMAAEKNTEIQALVKHLGLSAK